MRAAMEAAPHAMRMLKRLEEPRVRAPLAVSPLPVGMGAPEEPLPEAEEDPVEDAPELVADAELFVVLEVGARGAIRAKREDNYDNRYMLQGKVTHCREPSRRTCCRRRTHRYGFAG